MPGSADSRAHRKAGSRGCGCCTGEDEKRGLWGEGGVLGSWAQCAGPAANQGLLEARRAGAAAGTLERSPDIISSWGQQEPSH